MTKAPQTTAPINPAVAPTALNVFKKVAVIRHGDDTLNYEVDGSVKTVSVQDLGDAIKTATPLVVPRAKLDIPIPHITVSKTYHRDVPANFELHRSYVRFHRITTEEFIDRLDYVADKEDETWLENNTKFGGAVGDANDPASFFETKQGEESVANSKPSATSASYSSSSLDPLYHRPQLTIELFESMMDLLEKKTAFESIITFQQAEQLILARNPYLLQLFPAHVPRARVAASVAPVTIKTVLQDVYNYWVQKRSKLKRPLLRKFWPVTSTEDTNPHLVFRPREKEKYRLRKKRQNDLDAYQKLQQLRSDFASLRTVLACVKHREQLKRTQIQTQIDLFQQRMYEIVDTSGCPRLSACSKTNVSADLDVMGVLDSQRRKAKRARTTNGTGRAVEIAVSAQANRASGFGMSNVGREGGNEGGAIIVAGRNHGEPAPNFLQPLETRSAFVTSWKDQTPHVTTYVDSHPEPTFRFRHRPRVGRGGRICIDRLPLPPVDPSVAATTIMTAGKGLHNFAEPKERLLDLLPKPLNHSVMSRRIENICLASVKDDIDRARSNMGPDQDDYEGDEVVVRANHWLDTDDQLWGDERYTLYLG